MITNNIKNELKTIQSHKLNIKDSKKLATKLRNELKEIYDQYEPVPFPEPYEPDFEQKLKLHNETFKIKHIYLSNLCYCIAIYELCQRRSYKMKQELKEAIYEAEIKGLFEKQITNTQKPLGAVI